MANFTVTLFSDDGFDGGNLAAETTDGGGLSLREAIGLANAAADADTIGFAAALNGQTITLTSGELKLTSDITIDGDIVGADNIADITLSGNGNSRVFNITGDETDIALLSLNITDGFRNGSSMGGVGGAYGGAIGVGIANSSIGADETLYIADSTISDSYARFTGGAIAAAYGASVTAVRSTFTGNSAALSGAAVELKFATFDGSNITVTDNTGVGNARGTITARNDSTLTLTNSTITRNEGSTRAGVYNNGSSAELINTIVLGNYTRQTYSGANPDIGLQTFTLTNSITSGDPTAVFATTSALGNTNGGVLADNGGTVQTVALNADPANPALDIGDAPIGLATDATGNARAVNQRAVDNGGTVDAGAVERQEQTNNVILVTTTGDTTANDGETTLREAIAAANSSATIDTVAFDASLNGATLRLIQGAITISRDVTINGDSDGDTVPDIVITGDATDNDVTVGTTDITDIMASSEAQLSDNSRLFTLSADAVFQGLTLTGGRTTGASQSGGAINGASNDLTLIDSVISGNSVLAENARGGALNTSSGTITLINSTLSDNAAFGRNGDGGGLSASGTVTITDSTITGNKTYQSGATGGGVNAFNNLTITGSTITGNATYGRNSSGGGVFNYSGVVSITDSVIADNAVHDDTRTGGVYSSNGDITLTNTSVVGNASAGSISGGAGVYARTGDIALINSTVTGNVATGIVNSAGGVASRDGTVTLTNSIVSGNVSTRTSVNDLSQTATLIGGNIVGDTATVDGVVTATGITTADLFATTAQSVDFDANGTGVFGGVLADNGGGVQTVALNADIANPALDAGDDTVDTATDARGLARVDQPVVANNGANASDLGAFELQTQLPENDSLIVTITSDTSDAFDGETSLREAIAFANSDADASTITFASGAGAAFEAAATLRLTRGTLDITTDLTIDGSSAGGRVTVTGDALGDDATTTDDNGTVITDARNNADNDADNLRVFTITAGTVTLDTLTITGGDRQGGIGNSGGIDIAAGTTVTIANSSLSGNDGERGGGLYSQGLLTVENSLFSHNDADNGGGLFVAGETTISDSTIRNNRAESFAGGLGAADDLTLLRTTVSGNASLQGGAGGVGSSAGDVSIVDSTLSDNMAATDGGGLSHTASATLLNTTLHGNTAGHNGGGIHSHSGSLFVYSGTVTGNTATGDGASFGLGGGIYAVNGASLTNAIVLGNSAGNGAPELSGALTDNGGTITSGTPGDVFAALSGVGGALADNGGPVQTVALKADNANPAIDQGVAIDEAIIGRDVNGDGDTTDAITTDARGESQVDAAGATNNGLTFRDIGAFEVQMETPSLIVTTADDVVNDLDGETSLREAIAFANSDSDANTITFDASLDGATITLTNGELAITQDVTIDGDRLDDGIGDITIDADGNSRVFSVYRDGPNNDVTANFDGLTITGGMVTDSGGGGISFAYRTGGTISNSTITGNMVDGNTNSARGGGIYAGIVTDVTVTNSTISNNVADRAGGGIFAYRSTTLTVTNSVITGNDTSANSFSGYGGGIAANGRAASTPAMVTISGTTISNNTSGAYGGGITFQTTNFDIDGSTFENNDAGRNAGGLSIRSGGTGDVSNSTFVGNTAAVNGGGFYINTRDAVTASNLTLTGNQATSSGGGIRSEASSGNLTLTNILSLGNRGFNNADVSTFQDPTDGGGNILTGDAATIFATTVDVDGTLAGVLADNGGPVQTVALRAFGDNPALDVGAVPAGLTTDAAGNARGVDQGTVNNGGTVDAGALELQTQAPEAPSLIVTTADDAVDSFDGVTSLREAIAFANSQSGADTITFASGTGDAFEGDALIRLTGGAIEITGETIIDGSSAGGSVTITGDADDDDVTDANDITDVAASDVSFLDDNSRLFTLTAADADTTFDSLILTGGRTTGASENGGAIFTGAAATITLTNSTLSGNSTDGDNAQGGAIYGSSITLTNTTLSDNSTAGAMAHGGGLAGSTVMLTNSTLSGNYTSGTGAYGGGLSAFVATLTNNIVSGNIAGSGTYNDVYAIMSVSGGNIIGTNIYSDNANLGAISTAEIFATTQTLTVAGNSVQAGVLADNGGPVQTIALLNTSDNPALDAGLDILLAASVTTDARGQDRRADQAGIANNGANTIDLGAFELQSLEATGGDDVINGTSQADLIDLSDGGNDRVDGGENDDGFYFGDTFDNNDEVDGGGGDIDQIGLQGDYSDGITFGTQGTINIEQVVLLPGSDTRFGAPGTETYDYDLTLVDENIEANEQLVFQANTLGADEDFTLDASAEMDGSILTFAGFGAETLTGGQLDDGFFFGTGRFGPNDVVDGQGGFDSIGLRGDYASGLVFGENQITDIEIIAVLTNSDTRFDGGGLGTPFSYNLTMADGNVAAGETLIVSANTLVDNETLTFDGSAEMDGSFEIFSGDGNDTIIGSTNNDILSGLGGSDTLSGGGGNDVFLYTNASDSTPASADIILDFSDGDLVSLSRIDTFTFIADAAFSSTAGELRAVNTLGNDWTIEGDIDGDGTADIAIQLTTIDGITLDENDFVL